MDICLIKNKLYQKYSSEHIFIFSDAEEYFFILGQFLVYSFSCLGGIHKYRREFNYLTDPQLPKDVQQLGIRIIRFITKLPKDIINSNQYICNISQALVDNSNYYCHSNIDIACCTDAFFEGVHSKNIFEDIAEN